MKNIFFDEEPQTHDYTQANGTRVAITCECCGYRQELERMIDEEETPCQVHIICHECESPLWVDVEASDLVNV